MKSTADIDKLFASETTKNGRILVHMVKKNYADAFLEFCEKAGIINNKSNQPFQEIFTENSKLTSTDHYDPVFKEYLQDRPHHIAALLWIAAATYRKGIDDNRAFRILMAKNPSKQQLHNNMREIWQNFVEYSLKHNPENINIALSDACYNIKHAQHSQRFHFTALLFSITPNYWPFVLKELGMMEEDPEELQMTQKDPEKLKMTQKDLNFDWLNSPTIGVKDALRRLDAMEEAAMAASRREIGLVTTCFFKPLGVKEINELRTMLQTGLQENPEWEDCKTGAFISEFVIILVNKFMEPGLMQKTIVPMFQGGSDDKAASNVIHAAPPASSSATAVPVQLSNDESAYGRLQMPSKKLKAPKDPNEDRRQIRPNTKDQL